MTDRKPDRRTVLTGIAATALSAAAPANTIRPSSHGGWVDVPLDHSRPTQGRFPLHYGLLTPFDEKKKTVVVVADGQQFYVTPEAFAPSVRPVLGDQFNVVGVFGRADAAEVQERVGSGSSTDWVQAHRLLKADQWIADLEAVRRRLVGPAGRICLYGRSGGGLLVHQYLAARGQFVRTAFTQAAVNPYVAARFGLSSDRFWSEVGPAEQTRLRQLLASRRYPRERVARLFQRQNFFVQTSELAQARSQLIDDLEAGRSDGIASREKAYQLDALARLEDSPRGVAIRVRLFEFFAPMMDRDIPVSDRLDPDLEVSADFAEPLTKLLRAGAIPAPAMDFGRLHTLATEVCLVAGRWDHTCDYRTQIALATMYRSAQLLLLDDDHVFHRLQASAQAPALARGALNGHSSRSFVAAVNAIRDLRWVET